MENSLLGGTPPPRRSRRLYWGFLGPFVAGISLGVHDCTTRCHRSPGKQRWKFTTGSYVFSSPALNNDSVMFG